MGVETLEKPLPKPTSEDYMHGKVKEALSGKQ
jgi:hypothetical protein